MYVLSTREMRDVIKVGMTRRTVDERVREINSATGVAIPYGVRMAIPVKDAQSAEKVVHEVLPDTG